MTVRAGGWSLPAAAIEGVSGIMRSAKRGFPWRCGAAELAAVHEEGRFFHERFFRAIPALALAREGETLSPPNCLPSSKLRSRIAMAIFQVAMAAAGDSLAVFSFRQKPLWRRDGESCLKLVETRRWKEGL